MRKLAATILIGVGSIAVLTGCAESKSDVVHLKGDTEIFEVDLDNGKTVDCIYIIRHDEMDGYTGGPSCDWANAK